MISLILTYILILFVVIIGFLDECLTTLQKYKLKRFPKKIFNYLIDVFNVVFLFKPRVKYQHFPGTESLKIERSTIDFDRYRVIERIDFRAREIISDEEIKDRMTHKLASGLVDKLEIREWEDCQHFPGESVVELEILIGKPTTLIGKPTTLIY